MLSVLYDMLTWVGLPTGSQVCGMWVNAQNHLIGDMEDGTKWKRDPRTRRWINLRTKRRASGWTTRKLDDKMISKQLQDIYR